jgi:hypothetical protein
MTDRRAEPAPLQRLKSIGRSMGLNRAFDALWRHPVSDLRAMSRDGGPLERRHTEIGHAAMREAAKTLPALTPPRVDRGSRVHLLTGSGFWHQSVYCVASLQIVSDEQLTPRFYGDGTLDHTVRGLIERVLPWAEFVDSQEVDSRLDKTLPRNRYPTLRARRESYVHLRKLTDIHVFTDNWKLVLDSDLLFYRRADALLEWYSAPEPMFMRDVVDNYGYPLDYLETMAGAPLPKRMNVGLYGLNSAAIDWDAVESWCMRQLEDYGPSYLQEQGLTAMIFAGQPARALPDYDYVLMPKVSEGKARRAIMHHYVAHSKRSYFQYGWREIDARIRALA